METLFLSALAIAKGLVIGWAVLHIGILIAKFLPGIYLVKLEVEEPEDDLEY
jgi:hypothetical protein